MQSSGHWYFTLKDENAAINCAMFRQSNITVRFRPDNGMKVRVFGSVGLYAKTGSYQFYADSMEQDGLGELYLRFEALKNKLMAQGLFDASLKKQLPLLPKGIGVVTSPTGAVIHDICRVAWRRFPGMPIYLYPVKVQGDGAAYEIAQGITTLDRYDPVDVIIIGRGGGSLQDLWAFNEEVVARTVYACHKPVVSAVGHETDFTICDFAADCRAATPSAAAEITVPRKQDIALQIDDFEKCCQRIMNTVIDQYRIRITSLESRIRMNSAQKKTEQTLQRIIHIQEKMTHLMENNIAKKMHRIEMARAKILSANPDEVLKRGYAMVTSNNMHVTSVQNLMRGQSINVRMRDGSADAVVEIIHQ